MCLTWDSVCEWIGEQQSKHTFMDGLLGSEMTDIFWFLFQWYYYHVAITDGQVLCNYKIINEFE
jgi:hypothetical protein